MKKILFTLVALIGLTMSVKAQHLSGNTYKGFFDLGYIVGVTNPKINCFEVSTSHGMQITPNFFIGGGVGLQSFEEYKVAMDSRAKSLEIPIFANLRASFTNTKLIPFLDLKAGAYTTDEMGIYLNVSGGIRFALANNHGINLKIGYQMAKLTYDTFKDFYGLTTDYSTQKDKMSVDGLSLKIGYEF